MDETTINKLYEDFDIAIKPGQGFKYVRTRDILDRLNKTFAGNWGVQVKHHEMVEDEVLVLVSVHLYDDDGHIKATQEGFGSAKKFRNTELGNIYKSATSKAVKSAVRNWGVALFLEEDSSAGSQGTTTTRYDASTPNTSNTPSSPPSMPNTMPGPPTNTEAPPSMPSTPGAGMPSTIAPSGPPTPSDTPSTPLSTPSGPPSTPAPPQEPTVQAPPPSGPPSTPAPPSSEPSGELPTMNAVPGGPPPSTESSEEIHAITNVQKVAITSRLGAKGLTFDQISDEFYADRDSAAPDSIDGMLYVDALDMVAFLNTK